jgi:hypothetical protein
MSIDAISSSNCGYCAQLVATLQPKTDQAADLFRTLHPTRQTDPGSGLWWQPDSAPTIFESLLAVSQSLYSQGHAREEKVLAPWYTRIYLQYPNERLQALVDEITYGLVDNDEKATAIIRWTLQNFPYELDEVNYGYGEFWAPPTFALRKGSGDCEDGAFLVHSLLLHAGIPYDRIRTYGGLVEVGEGAATGGHAWTAYRRESDNQWVILDTSYQPTMMHVDDRPPMKDATLYTENFFYFNKNYWVNLENVDRIHDPGAIYAYGASGTSTNTTLSPGALVDALA